MSADSPDRISNKRLLDYRIVATSDQNYGQLRHEAQTRDLGQSQSSHDLSLRRAAEMETGRARNIYTIV
ncbi:MAG: hypothetical protein LBC90_00950 [Candidatus Adiutrix sp.]|jgi:hypothetical protein|nr:hypothetical protein [Candidatus Adiutrix sp.]